jgi:hypothetical protein
MFTRPPLVVAYAHLILTLLTLSVVLGPWPAPWGLFLPTAAATMQLRERHWVTRYSRCGDGAFDAWRQLRRDPHAAVWFRDLVRPGVPVASRAYGIAGLAAVAPAIVDSLRAAFTRADWAETMYVADQGESGPTLSLADLWPDLVDGTLARLIADTSRRPEC